MNDDELKRAHAALRRRRQASPEVTPPTTAELQSLVDGTVPADAREALLDRVFASGASDELALLQAMAQPSAAAQEWTFSSSARRVGPFVAAASLLLVFGLPALRLLRTDTRERPRFRGADSASETLALRTPTENANGTTMFVWSAVPEADRYTLELLDANAERVTQLETRDTSLAVADSVVRGARPATGWWVIAQLRGGGQRRSAVRPLTRTK